MKAAASYWLLGGAIVNQRAGLFRCKVSTPPVLDRSSSSFQVLQHLLELI